MSAMTESTCYRYSYRHVFSRLLYISASVFQIYFLIKFVPHNGLTFLTFLVWAMVSVLICLSLMFVRFAWFDYHTSFSLHPDKLLYTRGGKRISMSYNDIAIIKTRTSKTRQIKDVYGNEIILHPEVIINFDELIETLKDRARKAEIASTIPEKPAGAANQKTRRKKYMRVCGGCHETIYIDDRYEDCPECGHKLPEPRLVLFKNRSLNESVISVLIMLVIIAVVLLICKLSGVF